jgi:hypothetical protein
MGGCLFLCKGHLDLVLVGHLETIELLFRDARLEGQTGNAMLSEMRRSSSTFPPAQGLENSILPPAHL